VLTEMVCQHMLESFWAQLVECLLWLLKRAAKCESWMVLLWLVHP